MTLGDARGMPWRAGLAALLAGLLVGCVAPPSTDEGKSSAPAATGLRPLTRDLSVPAGARPRSAVPAVRYDLASVGQDELGPDDGVPGDDAPRTVYQRGGASPQATRRRHAHVPQPSRSSTANGAAAWFIV